MNRSRERMSTVLRKYGAIQPGNRERTSRVMGGESTRGGDAG